MAGLNPFVGASAKSTTEANPFVGAAAAASDTPDNPFVGGGKPKKPKGLLDKTVGAFAASAHKNPWEKTMDVLGAPQRALMAVEMGGDVGHAFMHPEDRDKLQKKVKSGLGLQQLEDTTLKGNDFWHKAARGVLDTGLDIVNDPLTFLPGGAIGKLAKATKFLPAAAKGLEESKLGRAASKYLNPNDYLNGLTEPAKAEFEAATNRAMTRVRGMKEAEDKIVAAHADEIRRGIMPSEVEKLFGEEGWQKHFTDDRGKMTFGPGTRPQDVERALFRVRAPEFKAAAMQDLRSKGFFPTANAPHHPGLFSNPAEAEYVQRDLEHALNAKFSDGNVLTQVLRTLTHRGNQAFLSNPIPHTGNLAALTYNEYGLPTLAKGIMNAARVATGNVDKGHLGLNVRELEHFGAKSQYSNIFDELGLTRIFGVPHTEGVAGIVNKFIIPLEKLSNVAQHKILNAAETGLRAAALDAERAGGKTGAEAARKIHEVYGTNAPSKIVEGARNIGTPFAHFHMQTAPASFARTLATNPGRIANLGKIQRDANQPGQPQYRSSVPGLSGSRALFDPESYWTGLGPLTKMAGPFGIPEQMKKGQLEKPLGELAGQFIPGSAEIGPMIEMLSNKPGRAGETGLADLMAAIFGGYFQKAPK